MVRAGCRWAEPARRWRYVGRVVTCLVALLALLALEDITTSVEPSFRFEWSMVAFASVWFLAAGARAWTRRSSGNGA